MSAERPGSEPVFEVFARLAPGDPMSHVGTLNAPHLDLARVYAWKIYDEEDWADMWVVPRDAIGVAHPDRPPTVAAEGPGS